MSKLTPIDVVKLIKDIVAYGDDPFEEAYTAILEDYNNCVVEEDKQFMKELLELLDILYERMFR